MYGIAIYSLNKLMGETTWFFIAQKGGGACRSCIDFGVISCGFYVDWRITSAVCLVKGQPTIQYCPENCMLLVSRRVFVIMCP